MKELHVHYLKVSEQIRIYHPKMNIFPSRSDYLCLIQLIKTNAMSQIKLWQ